MSASELNPVSAKSIYLDALDIEDSADRNQFLDGACSSDDGLRKEIEQLLAADRGANGGLLSRAQSYFNPPLSNRKQELTDPCNSGLAIIDLSTHPVIGRYELLEEIGRGGMGTVYLAQQMEPVKRRVALKVINPGMDSREVIARFESERQALAMMDHPNIARVLDAGTTESGRPYFVMELMRGVPVTDYCQQHHVGLDERLSLFVEVCHAVQHAHQKGIIHRDLKPSNVIVTGSDGVPAIKVIDFGVAKALHQDLTDKTLFTQFSQIIGTPLYISPEQAGLGNVDVDTRSDVYSLGVLLYELLTDTTPFDRKELACGGIEGARRIICEQEPQRPSTRLSTLKAAGDSTLKIGSQSESKRLAVRLRNELDWVIMKALEKDRTRRYESAVELARDLQRYLADEPVEACPPSVVYRMKKFVAKHKPLVATAATVLFAVFLGASIAAAQAVRATKAERLAKKQEQLAVKQQKLAQKAADRERKLAEEARQQRDEAERQRERAENALMLALSDSYPVGLAFGPNGNLFVTCSGIDAILEFNPESGDVIRQFVPAQNKHLKGPQGLTFGPDANRDGISDLYVASIGNNSVACFRGDTGEFIEQVMSAEQGELSSPTHVTFDQQGRLYVTSFMTNSVLRYNRDTKEIEQEFVPHGSGGLNRPQMACFGPDGNLYVASFGSNSVFRYDGETGKFLDEFVHSRSGGLDGPMGVSFGPDGNLYVVNNRGPSSFSVLRYSGKTGEFLNEFITHDAGALVGAHQIAFSPSGDVYLAQFFGDGVARFDGQTGEYLQMSASYDRRFLVENAIESPGLKKRLTDAYVMRADDCRLLGDLRGALPYYFRLTRAQPDRSWNWYVQALANLRVNGVEAYGDVCRSMLTHYEQINFVGDVDWFSRTCVLGPSAVDDYLPVVSIAKKAVDAKPDSHVRLMTLGAAYLRAGQPDKSVDLLGKALALATAHEASQTMPPTYACYFMAMAYHGLGNLEESRQWYDKARVYSRQEFEEDDKTYRQSMFWTRRLAIELLDGEVSQLLKAEKNN